MNFTARWRCCVRWRWPRPWRGVGCRLASGRPRRAPRTRSRGQVALSADHHRRSLFPAPGVCPDPAGGCTRRDQGHQGIRRHLPR
ncbi:MAG: hypothetical protein MZV70_74675 [Desulfobacterales bacterium]|nr:hypothetical protein [Desulfobacterales bacterium]